MYASICQNSIAESIAESECDYAASALFVGPGTLTQGVQAATLLQNPVAQYPCQQLSGAQEPRHLRQHPAGLQSICSSTSQDFE